MPTTAWLKVAVEDPSTLPSRWLRCASRWRRCGVGVLNPHFTRLKCRSSRAALRVAVGLWPTRVRIRWNALSLSQTVHRSMYCH